MTTIAVMQPYFFPYIGYWQLIQAVDRFVILDDVNYINRGWINRNRILVNAVPTYITAPLSHASQNKRICEIALQPSPIWRGKLLRSIEFAYRRSTYFDEVFPVIEKLVMHETDSLADYLVHQLQLLSIFMGIDTKFVLSSRVYQNRYLAGQQRIIDICCREEARTYINLSGGQSLYDVEAFGRSNLTLSFIAMQPIPYHQKCAEFSANLSIIDVLMENGKANIQRHLQAYELITPELKVLTSIPSGDAEKANLLPLGK